MEDKSTTNSDLSKQDIERYCRQILLPEISTSGQKLIKASKVLIIGAGGLGSPCSLYLAGAGIGTIGLVDGDSVEESNLHRQIIHNTVKKGINKAVSAKEMLKLFNPMINIIAFEEHLTSKNSMTICDGFDILIDCSDNPATRYLVNDTAVVLNKPLVSGSAVKWEGQLTIYNKASLNPNKIDDTPCYRCMFPLPTPASAICNCSDGGVFGPIPGMIGTLQANECVKLILGFEVKVLAKKMLIFDGLDLSFKVIKLRGKNKDCIACGKDNIFKSKKISEYDYVEFVNPSEARIPLRVKIEENSNVTWEAFCEKKKNEEFAKKSVFVDVRPNEQFSVYSIENFKNIPLKDLKGNFDSYKDLFDDKNKEIYVMCRRGNNSTYGTKFLIENGFKNVFNLEGGLAEYKKKIDQNVPEF